MSMSSESGESAAGSGAERGFLFMLFMLCVRQKYDDFGLGWSPRLLMAFHVGVDKSGRRCEVMTVRYLCAAPHSDAAMLCGGGLQMCAYSFYCRQEGGGAETEERAGEGG